MTDIIQAISTIGFPISMCLLLWWDKKVTVDANTQAINDIKMALVHVEAALNQNSEMISILTNSINKEV